MARPQKTFVEKPGDSFGRFHKAVKQILAIQRKRSTNERLSINGQRRRLRNKGDNKLVYWTYQSGTSYVLADCALRRIYCVMAVSSLLLAPAHELRGRLQVTSDKFIEDDGDSKYTLKYEINQSPKLGKIARLKTFG